MVDKVKIILEQPHSTVVSKYIPSINKQTKFQIEKELENALIKQLQSQGYTYLKINNEKELLENLKSQIEKLNNYSFKESEWKIFLDKYINNANDEIEDKAKKIQEDYIYTLKTEEGTSKNIYLLDKDNVNNNSVQVINQYNVKGIRENIYDVTILVNGLPLVHIELKKRGVSIKEAFNQISRNKRETFNFKDNLYKYVQIFVISNGTDTKYFSNTVKKNAQKEMMNQNTTKTSNSFEFTSYWASKENKTIRSLKDFTSTFFDKRTILNIITKYCVYTANNSLLVLRPYQITATEEIISKINVAYNNKWSGTIEAGGYIWHTTGSGKTLTSFKTARIASKLDYIDKVLFIVDRKDLDYQTMKEYDKYEKGAANSNSSTKILQKQLEDFDKKIIITTIQKLNNFIKNNPNHLIFSKEVVLIFDECHRSQFGNMHQQVVKSFKKYYIFGFTGTPILEKNANYSDLSQIKTTKQLFGQKLHTYTIVNAINDENVLKFKVDYLNTSKKHDFLQEKEVLNIDEEKALLDPRRIAKNTEYIIEHFHQKTKREGKWYELNYLLNVEETAKAKYYQKFKNDIEKYNKKKVQGFNSIFTVFSIEAAKKYYDEFKKQQKNILGNIKLKIATIYSWSANQEIDGSFDENNENTDQLNESDRDFLDKAIEDYNEMFGTTYDTSSEKFQNYYKDISLRVKNREIDLLIVVNMFLTGFDAPTLNTLWVDKNMKMHGLIQAFSRTNRILNISKAFGNIVCFRNLEKKVEEAISLFGDEKASEIVLIKTFKDYYEGYEDFEGYTSLIKKLSIDFPLEEEIIGETKEKHFVLLFNKILKLKNILQSFDDFKGKEILSEFQFQDYQSIYNRIYEKHKNYQKAELEIINDDLEFEIELVKSVEVNIDYILMLLAKAKEEKQNIDLSRIEKIIDASPSLRSKKTLIEKFIKKLNNKEEILDQWVDFVQQEKEQELEEIIKLENLKPEETKEYMKQALEIGELKNTGTSVSKIIPPQSFFAKENEINREEKKKNIYQILLNFFDKYFDI